MAQALDCQNPQVQPASSVLLFLLLALPIAATGVSFLSAADWVGEPFGSLDAREVCLFFGAPLFCIAAAVRWCVVARRRGHTRLYVVLVLLWFGLMLGWSLDSLVSYFYEPWNM